MNKLEKPKLFKQPVITTLGTILGILAIYNFFNGINDIIKIIISVIIALCVLIYNIIIYCINVNKLYAAYEERIINHEALAEQYKLKNKELLEKNELLKLYTSALFNCYNVVFGLLMAKKQTDVEKIKDEQMANVLKEFTLINYLNGGNKDE